MRLSGMAAAPGKRITIPYWRDRKVCLPCTPLKTSIPVDLHNESPTRARRISISMSS